MSNKIDLEIEFNEVTSKLPKSIHSFIVKHIHRIYFPKSSRMEICNEIKC